MSHGERASLKASRCGRDYWSRRAGLGGCPKNPWWKRFTHRLERLIARREIREELKVDTNPDRWYDHMSEAEYEKQVIEFIREAEDFELPSANSGGSK